MESNELLQTVEETGQVSDLVVDRAVRNGILYKLRKAMRYNPDGSRARVVSILDALGDEELLQVAARLKSAKQRGKPVYEELAHKIQKDFGKLTDLTIWHVSRAIMAYEARLGGLLGQAESVPELAEWTAKKREIVDKIVERVDGLDTLSKAIKIQIQRIDGFYQREQSLGGGVPIKGLNKELKVLNELVDTYLKYSIELGIYPRQPYQLNIGFAKQGLEMHRRKIDTSVGMDRMLTASEKFLDTLKNQEGVFEVVELDDE